MICLLQGSKLEWRQFQSSNGFFRCKKKNLRKTRRSILTNTISNKMVTCNLWTTTLYSPTLLLATFYLFPFYNSLEFSPNLAFQLMMHGGLVEGMWPSPKYLHLYQVQLVKKVVYKSYSLLFIALEYLLECKNIEIFLFFHLFSEAQSYTLMSSFNSTPL